MGFVSVYRDKTNCRKQRDLNAKRPKIKLEKMDFLLEKVAAFPRGCGYFTEKEIKRRVLQFSQRKKFIFKMTFSVIATKTYTKIPPPPAHHLSNPKLNAAAG